MNAGHFGLGLAGLGFLMLLGSAYGMSQVSTPNLEKSTPVEVSYLQADYVEVWTDPQTGCKYFRDVSSGSSYQPRLKPNGLPLCE